MSDYFLNPWAFFYFLSCLILFVLGLFLLFKKHTDVYVRLYVVFLFFTSIHCFSAGMAASSNQAELWRGWTLCNACALILSVTTMFHFSQLYRIKGKVLDNKRLFLIYGILILFFALVLSNPEGLMFSDIVETENTAMGRFGRGTGSAPPVFFAFFYLTICLMLACSIINFFRMLRDVKLRRRASYFLLGSLFPLIGYLFVFLSILIFTRSPPVHFGIVFFSLTGLTIGYGIVKEGLFDIDVIVKKSVLYTMMTFVLAVVFFVIEEGLERVISSMILSGIQLSWLISAGAVILVFFPVKIGCQKITNKLFPDTKEQDKNLKIYRTQLEHALADGKITKKERAMLKELRKSLDIPNQEHERMRSEIEEGLKKSG